MARTLQQLLDWLHRQLGDPGAAACVVRDGEVADEAVTGTLDGARPWAADTLTMTYSCAKPFAALTVLTAVAEGALGLDQPVAELWPAYAAHGKQATTVRHVLAHQAGLPALPGGGDGRRLRRPRRPGPAPRRGDAGPRTRGGLRRARTDLRPPLRPAGPARHRGGPRGPVRPASPPDHGWDLHLRVDREDLGRVADPVAVEPDWPVRYTDDPRWGPAMTRPAGPLDPAVLGSERWRTTSFPAIGLHASARGLATFYGQLMDEDGAVADLLGPELHRAYLAPQVTGHDLLLDREVTWTLGFQRDDADLGMGGAGGSGAWFSFTGRYAAALRHPRPRHPRPQRRGLRPARGALLAPVARVSHGPAPTPAHQLRRQRVGKQRSAERAYLATSAYAAPGSASLSGSTTVPAAISGFTSSGTSQTLTFMAARIRSWSSSQNATNSRPATSPRTTTRAVSSRVAWPTYSMPRSYWSLKKYGSRS